MVLDEIKAEIVSVFKQELLNLRVPVEDADIRSTESGKTWSFWVEQEGGMDTSGDKFIVDLDDLKDGLSYFPAIGYRVRRWVGLDKDMKALKKRASQTQKMLPILMADDDEGDCMLVTRAMKANLVENPVVTVANGEELLDYLYHRGKFSDSSPAPSFILLDLNMPLMGGREALRIIKSDKNFQKIPVVVLSTSKAEEDIAHCYENGANSYITKPGNFTELVESMRILQDYWLSIVQLPNEKNFHN